MSHFAAIYEQSMSHEGTYSNDPRDMGGETWKGISRKKNPKWGGWKLIDEIKANAGTKLEKAMQADEELEIMVKDFYQIAFFEPMLLGKIEEFAIASELFDTAINQGVVNAVKYLQESLNLLNDNQKHYADILVDGHMGSKTLGCYNAYMQTANLPGRSTDRNTKTLLKALNGLQFERYVEICEQNKTQEAYFYGWLNRV